jgi:hypothetical protein
MSKDCNDGPIGVKSPTPNVPLGDSKLPYVPIFGEAWKNGDGRNGLFDELA